MKAIFVVSVLLAVLIVIDGTTVAPAQNAPLYRYCLLERGSGGLGARGEMMTCRYNTWAQCMASKSGNTDTCIVNPQLTFLPR